MSSLDVKNFKPLVKAPNKWTASFVIRMLLNGQFKDLKKSGGGKFTDDHKGDLANNYGKNDKRADPKDIAKEIFNYPKMAGFQVKGQTMTITTGTINYNDEYTLTIKLN